MNPTAVCLGLFLIAGSTMTAASQARSVPEQWMGIWKMNVAESTYQAGNLPRSRILRFEPVTAGVKATSDLLDDVGAVHIEFTAPYDGKEVPLHGPVSGQTIGLKRIDHSTFDTVQKSQGKITATTRFVVSGGGKRLTATTTGADDQGRKYVNVSVYDKQP